jgi:hypothetical protein
LAFETTAVRLWKRLTPNERLDAATAFWNEPPQEALAGALGAVVKARRLRPQVARSLPAGERARILAGVLDPGESVAASLLVALHLAQRRPLLAAFLDALGLAHEDGVLEDEEGDAPAPLADGAVRAAIESLRTAHDAHEVQVYLNTLWLQDPERWAALESDA